MNLLKIPKKYKAFIFTLILSLFCVIFYIDFKILFNEITLLLPYILLLSLSTLIHENKTGLFFLFLTIIFWFISKTKLFSNLSLVIYLNLIIKSTFIILQYLLILYIKKLYYEVEELSLVDELTGLKNRRGFYILAQYELNNINRKNKFISALFIDIDNFKTVNDTKGHKEGDKILKELSRVIINSTRNIDICTRFGGDEFCVLLPEVNQKESKEIVKRINDNFNESCIHNLWAVSLSTGVFSTKKKIELEELIKRSDVLMYKAKNSGKGKIAYEID